MPTGSTLSGHLAPKPMTQSSTDTIDTCPIEKAVVHTLLYFELFAHPLLASEVHQFCTESCATLPEVTDRLQKLVDQGVVFHYDGYYQTKPEPDWVSQRALQNARADQFLPIARRKAALIGAFPFVRSVCVSGSLSKHCMRPDSDVDFFIITAPGRLWLCRTLLVLYKKLVLFNSHKLFCVNYFIDTDHLTIEEQNVFTATETVTLLPMYGRDCFEKFCAVNTWARHIYPHFPTRSMEHVPPPHPSWWKNTMENLFSGKLGAWLDEKTMFLTVGHWKRKFKHLDSNSFEVALKSRRYVSKHHPLHFQQRVLARLDLRMREILGETSSSTH
jgi:hypothetical protein